jgi:hypothetical protein
LVKHYQLPPAMLQGNFSMTPFTMTMYILTRGSPYMQQKGGGSKMIYHHQLGISFSNLRALKAPWSMFNRIIEGGAKKFGKMEAPFGKAAIVNQDVRRIKFMKSRDQRYAALNRLVDETFKLGEFKEKEIIDRQSGDEKRNVMLMDSPAGGRRVSEDIFEFVGETGSVLYEPDYDEDGFVYYKGAGELQELGIVRTVFPGFKFIPAMVTDHEIKSWLFININYRRVIDKYRVAYRPQSGKTDADEAVIEVDYDGTEFHLPVAALRWTCDTISPFKCFSDAILCVSQRLSTNKQIPWPIEPVTTAVYAITLAAFYFTQAGDSPVSRVSAFLKRMPRAEGWYAVAPEKTHASATVDGELLKNVTITYNDKLKNHWRGRCLLDVLPEINGTTIYPAFVPEITKAEIWVALTKRVLQDVDSTTHYPDEMIQEAVDWIISNIVERRDVNTAEVLEACEKQAAAKFGRGTKSYSTYMEGARCAVEGGEPGTKRVWSSFIKEEFYAKEATLRFIIAPDVYSRGYDHAATYAAQKRFFAPSNPHTVKGLTGAQIFDKILENGAMGNVVKQDISGFELRVRLPYLEAGRRVALALAPEYTVAINHTYDALCKPHTIYCEHFVAKDMPPSVLSGCDTTSFGNAVANIIQFYCTMKTLGSLLKWSDFFLVEGDDLMFKRDILPCDIELYERTVTEHGFKTTLELFDDPLCADYLGYHGALEDGKLVLSPINPYYTLSRIAYGVGVNLSTNHNDAELLYAKCLSALVKYPDCPITPVLIQWAIAARARITRFTSVSKKYVSSIYHDTAKYDVSDLTNSFNAFLIKHHVNTERDTTGLILERPPYSVNVEHWAGMPEFITESNPFNSILMSIDAMKKMQGKAQPCERTPEEVKETPKQSMLKIVRAVKNSFSPEVACDPVDPKYTSDVFRNEIRSTYSVLGADKITYRKLDPPEKSDKTRRFETPRKCGYSDSRGKGHTQSVTIGGSVYRVSPLSLSPMDHPGDLSLIESAPSVQAVQRRKFSERLSYREGQIREDYVLQHFPIESVFDAGGAGLCCARAFALSLQLQGVIANTARAFNAIVDELRVGHSFEQSILDLPPVVSDIIEIAEINVDGQIVNTYQRYHFEGAPVNTTVVMIHVGSQDSGHYLACSLGAPIRRGGGPSSSPPRGVVRLPRNRRGPLSHRVKTSIVPILHLIFAISLVSGFLAACRKLVTMTIFMSIGGPLLRFIVPPSLDKILGAIVPFFVPIMLLCRYYLKFFGIELKWYTWCLAGLMILMVSAVLIRNAAMISTIYFIVKIVRLLFAKLRSF